MVCLGAKAPAGIGGFGLSHRPWTAAQPRVQEGALIGPLAEHEWGIPWAAFGPNQEDTLLERGHGVGPRGRGLDGAIRPQRCDRHLKPALYSAHIEPDVHPLVRT